MKVKLNEQGCDGRSEMSGVDDVYIKPNLKFKELCVCKIANHFNISVTKALSAAFAPFAKKRTLKRQIKRN